MKTEDLRNMTFPAGSFEFAHVDERIHDKKFDTKPISFFQSAMRRFAKNKSSIVAGVIIVVLLMFAIIGVEVSGFAVDFVDKDYINYLPKSKAFEWLGWDGTRKMTISEAEYWSYVAMAEETGHNPILEVYKDYDVEVLNGKIKTVKHFYDVKIDTYYKAGNMFKTVTDEEYAAIQKYQDENNIQIIYPAIPVASKDQAASLNQYNANMWYEILSDKGANKEIPVGVKADRSGVDFVSKYVAFRGYDETTGAPRDGYTSKMTIEEGERQYDYAIRKQNSWQVRVNTYNYFMYKYGREPEFWFGTNQFGQDIFTRLSAGARFSLILAVCVATVNFILGALIGCLEGYYGGVFDITMQRIIEIISRIPGFAVFALFNLHLSSKVGVIPTLMLAFMLTGWIGPSELLRMQFYRFKNQEYVLAARTLGAKDGRLMFKHILPNAIGTVITSTVMTIPGVIGTESSLTYLGIINLNSDKITSVGTLLTGGNAVIQSYPHIILFPAIFISLLMISFNLFGNGLRDAFNPQLIGTEG